LLALVLLLAGCKIPAPEVVQATKEDPQRIITAAAQTAQARRQPVIDDISTITPSAATATTVPTPSPSAPAAATVFLSTTAPGSTAGDQAEFVKDLNVPDGTAFKPNEPFIKTWRLRNTGENSWSTDYALVFAGGELMSGPPAIPIPREVLPGETIDLSVNLVAPSVPASSGTYQGFWKLRNAAGQTFGVGPDGGNPFWVTIAISGSLTELTGTPVTGASIVTGLILKLDEPSFSGACPHTFKFTAAVSLSQAATITYVLEAGAQDGSELKLPPPATSNLDAGTHTVVYELVFSQNLAGWARLHVTSPESVYSNQVNFTITCQ
jgi:hypothetical protein